MVDTSKAQLVKRRLLYVIRDEKGKIDNSDLFLLKAIYTICHKVKVILCGDFEADNVHSVLKEFCDEIVIKNKNYSDFEALRDEIILNGYDKNYDLLFVNNSVFGPFYPLHEIISTMSRKEYDFWGLTRVGERVTEQWEVIPEHLQMYFLVIGERMLHSSHIVSFFQSERTEQELEYEFTAYFENCGFRWGSYIDIGKYNANTVTKNIDLLYEVSYELVSKYKFPFLKKDYFACKSLSNSMGTDLKHTVGYLADRNLYHVDFIWECILRKYNIVQIKDSMQLNFILSADNHVPESEISVNDYRKTAVIMHLAYEESIDRVYQYITGIPEAIKKIFVVISEGLGKYLEKILFESNCSNYEIRVMHPNRGRDMNSLFVVCRDVWERYSYLCFTHDKRTSGESFSDIVGKEFMDILWDNTLASSGYIARVLALLKRHGRLGYLAVPPPYHANYCGTLARAWGKSYGVTRDLAQEMHLEVDISEEFPPFALGNAFWCKTAALKNIIDYHLETEDFCEEPMPGDGTISHALERIMIFAAQNAGYYSGIVENKDYAQSELNNKNYMLTKMLEKIFVSPQFCAPVTFFRLAELINDHSFQAFIEKRKKLYIWGAGKTGKSLAWKLGKIGHEIEGYICSEGYAKPNAGDKEVYYPSEIDGGDTSVGIIVAVHKKFYKELETDLEEIKENVYYL